MNNGLLQLNLSRDETIFAARIRDLFVLCEKTNVPKFSSFLDLRQQKIALYVAGEFESGMSVFFGGASDAERKILGIFPDYVSDRESVFPISLIKIIHSRPISHRDILGSVMSLGIKREMIGDIFVGKEKSYILALDSMSEHIISQIEKIANVGVKLENCTVDEISECDKRFEECSVIVSSLRVDCVVAAISGKSRNDCAKLIKSEMVSVDYSTVTSVSKLLSEGNTVSVRSVGKFVIGNVVSKTKKDRLVLNYKKYI